MQRAWRFDVLIDMTSAVSTRVSPLLAVWSVLMALSLTSRPLESPDLWWDLARGREVQEFRTLRPSQNLLTLDHASEAHWLGGVPFYGVWSVAGVFGLAAIPLIAALLLTRRVIRWAADHTAFAAVVVAPLTILATRPELEPTAALFDLLGLTGVWLALKIRPDHKSLPWILAAVFVAWANLGSLPLWGLLLIAAWPQALPARRASLLASLLAGMLTPRGPLTWLDSATLFAPTAFTPQSALEPRWHSSLMAGWDASLAAAALLWLVVVTTVVRRRSNGSILDWAMIAVPTVAALLSRANVAPAALWMTFHWLTLIHRAPNSAATRRPFWLRPAIALATALAVIDACGLVPGSQTMGWGLSQAIDPRLLEISDAVSGDEPAIAWAADSRSAGVAAWAQANTKLVDHPIRALLSGRSATHAAVRRDLTWAHRSAYRLDDGSWGGWGRPFADWNVEVLFVPAEDTDLHRGLLETPWKLLKLDSPTVPYASAENPRFDRTIVDVILQQGFVETGAWQPSIDVYDPRGWRLDASSLLGLGPSAGPAIRQSRFFRAVKLPMAALRALEPVRLGGGSAAVRVQFLDCQEALALEEYNATGTVSLFRRLALDVPGIAESDSQPWKRTSWAHWDKTPQHWRKCLDHYRTGQTRDAITALPDDGANEAYARGLMLLETGQIDDARTAFESAVHAAEPAMTIAARYWLNQLSPAEPVSRLTTWKPDP